MDKLKISKILVLFFVLILSIGVVYGAYGNQNSPKSSGSSGSSSSSSSSSSSGGGSGGSGLTLPSDVNQGTNNIVTLESPSDSGSKPLNVKLKEGTKVSFSIKSSSESLASEHSVTLTDLFNTETAKLTVASTPQTFDLKLTESKSFDFDSDGNLDFKVTLNSITWALQYADFTFELLTPGKESVGAGEAGSGAEEGASGEEDEETKEGSGAGSWLPIALLVVVVIVVLVALVLVFSGQKKGRR